MLKFYGGWMNIRQNKGGAMIIFLFLITPKNFQFWRCGTEKKV